MTFICLSVVNPHWFTLPWIFL